MNKLKNFYVKVCTEKINPMVLFEGKIKLKNKEELTCYLRNNTDVFSLCLALAVEQPYITIKEV